MRLIDADKLNFVKLQDTNGKAVPANEYIAFLKGAIAAEELIKKAPTIDAEPVVHGHWIQKGFDCVCSNCGSFNGAFGIKYCPNCGAKMDEEQGCEI